MYADLQQQAEREIADKNIITERTSTHGLLDYKNEGNKSMYKIENLMARKDLLRHPEIRLACDEFWQLVDLAKTESGTLTKSSYMVMNLKLHLALVPDVDMEEAKMSAELDWNTDTNGTGELDHDQFFASMFELADTWVEEIDGMEYAAFLRRLFFTIIDTERGDRLRFKEDSDIVCQTAATLDEESDDEEDAWEFDENEDVSTSTTPTGEGLDLFDKDATATTTAATAATAATPTTGSQKTQHNKSFTFSSKHGWGGYDGQSKQRLVGSKCMVQTPDDPSVWAVGTVESLEGEGDAAKVCVRLKALKKGTGKLVTMDSLSNVNFHALSSPKKRRRKIVQTPSNLGGDGEGGSKKEKEQRWKPAGGKGDLAGRSSHDADGAGEGNQRGKGGGWKGGSAGGKDGGVYDLEGRGGNGDGGKGSNWKGGKAANDIGGGWDGSGADRRGQKDPNGWKGGSGSAFGAYDALDAGPYEEARGGQGKEGAWKGGGNGGGAGGASDSSGTAERRNKGEANNWRGSGTLGNQAGNYDGSGCDEARRGSDSGTWKGGSSSGLGDDYSHGSNGPEGEGTRNGGGNGWRGSGAFDGKGSNGNGSNADAAGDGPPRVGQGRGVTWRGVTRKGGDSDNSDGQEGRAAWDGSGGRSRGGGRGLQRMGSWRQSGAATCGMSHVIADMHQQADETVTRLDAPQTSSARQSAQEKWRRGSRVVSLMVPHGRSWGGQSGRSSRVGAGVNRVVNSSLQSLQSDLEAISLTGTADALPATPETTGQGISFAAPPTLRTNGGIGAEHDDTAMWAQLRSVTTMSSMLKVGSPLHKISHTRMIPSSRPHKHAHLHAQQHPQSHLQHERRGSKNNKNVTLPPMGPPQSSPTSSTMTHADGASTPVTTSASVPSYSSRKASAGSSSGSSSGSRPAQSRNGFARKDRPKKVLPNRTSVQKLHAVSGDPRKQTNASTRRRSMTQDDRERAKRRGSETVEKELVKVTTFSMGLS
jgi:hypothetical protein